MAGYDAETQALRAALAESSSVLFERAVPVALRSGDKEDRVEELTVRVSMGVSKQFHNSKVQALSEARDPQTRSGAHVCAAPVRQGHHPSTLLRCWSLQQHLLVSAFFVESSASARD